MWDDEPDDDDDEVVIMEAAAQLQAAGLELRDLTTSFRRGVRTREQRRLVVSRAAAALQRSRLVRQRARAYLRIH